MKKFFVLFTCVLVVSVIFVVSCNKDDEPGDFYDLNVSSHTAVTRSSASDGTEDNMNNVARVNMSFIPHNNACNVTALVYAWMDYKRMSYFADSDCEMNAQQYYDKLIADILKGHSKYYWTPDSPSMKMSTFLDIAKDFPIGDKNNSFECIDFETSSTTATEYFNDRENRKKVVAIILRHSNYPQEKDHLAYVTSCNKSTVSFQGFDIFNPTLKTLKNDLKIDVGKTKKNWRISGVVQRVIFPEN